MTAIPGYTGETLTRAVNEYGLPGALIAAADQLGEPSLEPGSNP